MIRDINCQKFSLYTNTSRSEEHPTYENKLYLQPLTRGSLYSNTIWCLSSIMIIFLYAIFRNIFTISSWLRISYPRSSVSAYSHRPSPTLFSKTQFGFKLRNITHLSLDKILNDKFSMCRHLLYLHSLTGGGGVAERILMTISKGKPNGQPSLSLKRTTQVSEKSIL